MNLKTHRVNARGTDYIPDKFRRNSLKNNRKKFGWNITEIADCAFSSSVTLWPWPLTSAPINVYSCSTSYYLSTGQIWERYDEKWQRNRRTQIVGKKNKNKNKKEIRKKRQYNNRKVFRLCRQTLIHEWILKRLDNSRVLKVNVKITN